MKTQKGESESYSSSQSWVLESRGIKDRYRYEVDSIPSTTTPSSVLFKAYDKAHEHHVMLKVDKYPNEEDYALALEEGIRMRDINHPNIPHVYRIINNIILPNNPSLQKRNGIIMQYIEGPTLKEILALAVKNQQSPNIPLLVDQLFQIADVIHFMNTEKELTHRDVKPSNIMIENNIGKPYLIDFGLAKSNENNPGILTGTPQYLSPELCYDYFNTSPSSHNAPSESNDIFALGVLTYEALTGSWPYGDGSELDAEETMRAIATLPHIKLSDLKQMRVQIDLNLLTQMDKIFEKVLAKDPKERYRDPTDFITDLSELLVRTDIHKLSY